MPSDSVIISHIPDSPVIITRDRARSYQPTQSSRLRLMTLRYFHPNARLDGVDTFSWHRDLTSRTYTAAELAAETWWIGRFLAIPEKGWAHYQEAKITHKNRIIFTRIDHNYRVIKPIRYYPPNTKFKLTPYPKPE